MKQCKIKNLKWKDYKRDGLLGSIPIHIPERDKAWDKLIRMSGAKDIFGKEFPVESKMYLMFCMGWQIGFDEGFIQEGTKDETT